MEDNNTSRSFADKWHINKDLAFSNTLKEGSDIQTWILNRNGWRSLDDLRVYLKDKKNVLDAGCGNGRVTALLRMCAPAGALVTGIDLTAADVAKDNLSDKPNTRFFTRDLLSDNSDLGKFDFIYCQEVLHHTGNAFKGFRNLVKCNLSDNGEIAIYVYKQKAPVREYTDDYIRTKIASLDYEQAMSHCRQIAELSKNLSAVEAEFECPDIDILSIPAGRYTPQRFLYHFFMKCFWNPELDFEANAVINYDWYHPQDCTRHTVEEVRSWFEDLDLEITHTVVDHYGITMRGRKHPAGDKN